MTSFDKKLAKIYANHLQIFPLLLLQLFDDTMKPNDWQSFYHNLRVEDPISKISNRIYDTKY